MGKIESEAKKQEQHQREIDRHRYKIFLYDLNQLIPGSYSPKRDGIRKMMEKRNAIDEELKMEESFVAKKESVDRAIAQLESRDRDLLLWRYFTPIPPSHRNLIRVFHTRFVRDEYMGKYNGGYYIGVGIVTMKTVRAMENLREASPELLLQAPSK